MSSSTSTMNKSSQSYIKTGLGGAGNFHTKKTTSNKTTKTTRAALIPRINGVFSSGIGGAGNSHSLEARRKSNLVSEAQAQSARECRSNNSPNGHHGIGGAGNTRTQTCRNSYPQRSTMYEAWQRKLPSLSSADKIIEYDEKSLISSSTSRYSESGSFVSKISNIKDRVFWKVDRVISSGLDEGLNVRPVIPVYCKMEVGRLSSNTNTA